MAAAKTDSNDELTKEEMAHEVRRPNIELLLDAVETTEKAAAERANSDHVDLRATGTTTTDTGQPVSGQSAGQHRRNIDMLLDAVESTKMAADAESKINSTAPSTEILAGNSYELAEEIDSVPPVASEVVVVTNGFEVAEPPSFRNDAVKVEIVAYLGDCNSAKPPVTTASSNNIDPNVTAPRQQPVVRRKRSRRHKLKDNVVVRRVRAKRSRPPTNQKGQGAAEADERSCTEMVVPVDPQSLDRSGASPAGSTSDNDNDNEDDCQNLLEVEVPIPFRSVGTKELSHSAEAIDFALSHNLMKKFRDCARCGKQVALNMKTLTFRCSRQLRQLESGRKVRCEWYQSAKSGTWFEKTCMTLQGVLHITFLWLMMRRPRQAFVMEQLQCSTKTVVDWASYCREVCVFYVESESEVVGGAGRMVEIYEPRIVNRRRRGTQILDGTWIFGGYERESGKVFIVPVPRRNSDALLMVIKLWVRPDTVVVSDCWRSYKCVGEESYRALSASHRYRFVEHEKGDHVDRVEQVWREVRCSIPRNGPCDLQLLGCLSEFMFKRKFSDSESRTLNFFHTVTKMYPGK